MKNKISIIVIILLMVACLVGALLINSDGKSSNHIKTKKNGVVENLNKGITKDQKYEELDFTETSLSYVKGTGTTYRVTVTNNTNKVIDIEAIDIILKDKDGNVITTLYGYLGGKIEPLQENSIKTTTKEDLTNAYSVEYKVSEK